MPDQPAENVGQGLARLDGDGIAPDAQRLVELVEQRGDLLVLTLHQPHQPSRSGTAIEQQRPDVLVFVGVVIVQQGDHSLHVITDDLGPVVLARYDSTDESGHQCELAAEHVVNHEHIAAVEVRLLVRLR